MGRHLSESEFVDLAEGLADPAARAHAESCEACQARAEALRETLGAVRDVPVPEPPSAYWEGFRGDVDRRIAQAEAPGWRAPRRWVPALAGLAAAAAVAFVSYAPPVPAPQPTRPVPVLPAWSALPASEDVGLELIQALAPSPEDAASESCRAAYDCLAALSDDESAAVAETLRQELDGRSL